MSDATTNGDAVTHPRTPDNDPNAPILLAGGKVNGPCRNDIQGCDETRPHFHLKVAGIERGIHLVAPGNEGGS